ncbi:MAG: carboxypeptidase regulatory-like domain-containing protein, partial [Muribaculaceae bacterium]|nr:carboxypeptidase regulatory-like domain-containing protein [Muribaculaceae bacterium]
MRHCFRVLMLGMAVALSSVCSGFSAKAAIDNTAYGILAFSADQYRLTNNVVTFDLLNDSEPVFATAVGFAETSTAGAYGGNFYYIATSQNGADGEVPKSLVRVDLTNGNYATVGPLTGFDYLINDMTYDWSTSKMYCVSRVDNAISALYTIDLSTAQTKRVANLDRRFFTLAASYAGQLYGISFAGEFCSIDKATGAVTVIGHTGHYPQNFQTMEFDHAERTLYWVASTRKFNESGTIEVPESFMATIDLNTGEANRLQNFGDNQLVGLYIPSFAAADNCPAPVTSPAVAPAPQGASSATISWVNPSATFGGEILKNITKVEISRDGTVVGTVTNAQPGKASSFVDNINDASGKVYDWRITAYNANGAGASVAISAFVGKDEPAAVTGIVVEKLSPNSARISWNAVTVGKNGGWTDTETMKYDVVRQPGNVKVAEDIETNSWDEPGVEESGTYYYEITAINSCGTSAVAVSPSITLGPKLGVPYTCTFTDDFGQWTPIDANEDGNTWVRNAISWAKADGAYFMAANNAGDDWLVSNTIEFEPNSAYKVRLYCFANGTHPLDFYLLKDSDRENPLQMITTLELTRTYELGWKEFQFTTGAEIGDCNLAIHNRAEKGNSYMIIDRMEIEKLANKNLAATALRGMDKPIEGNTYTYNVSVANKGSDTYDTYEVALIDQDGKTVISVVVDEPIEGGESKDVLVEYTYPMKATVTSLCAKVIAAGDEIAADDVTPALDITLLPVGSPEEVNIGVKTSTSYNIPLNLYYKYGASLNIYDATEVGVKRGRITGLKFSGNLPSYSSAPKNVSVKVYLANTDRTLASEGWIPENEMTLVYNDTIDLVNGDNVLDLELNRAFDYDGRNLAMLTVTSLDKSNVSYSYFSQPYYNSPISGNKAIIYNGNYDAFNFANNSSNAYGNSVIKLMVQSGGASITGVVTNSAGEPLEGAEVEIKELNAFATSAADGSYRFDFVPNDTYTLSVSMFGYSADGAQTVTIEDADATANFVLNKIPTYSVWGIVKDAAGTPLADAAIELAGYADRSTITDGEGKFTFDDVVAYAETSVNVAKPWYVDAELVFNLAANTNLGDITLEYAHYAPATISTEVADGEAALVAWTDPASVSELRYDSGVAKTQVGLSLEVGTAVIGTVFRTPMT